MTDTDDAPEIIETKREKRRILLTDRVLAATGLMLAAAAAFFPWYVFFNSDKFGLNVANMDRTRDLPHTGPREVFSVSPLAMINRNKNEDHSAAPPSVDPLVTATVPQPDRPQEVNNGLQGAQQPFPGRTGFRLLHVVNGRAMIEDGSGMYMVRVGSILPDNSRLARIEQQNGQWVIVTSGGAVVSTGQN